MGESVQRIKDWIKSQKGFTLIELMAVLAILALILLIAVPAGGAMIEKAKKSADKSSIALMEDAGEKAHANDLPFDAVDADLLEEESYKIPTLIEKGYLKMDADNKFNKSTNYVMKKNKGGEFIFNGGKASDGAIIDRIEQAAKDANADGLPFDSDAPEPDSYTVPTLIDEGFLELETDSKFNTPDDYAVKQPGGEFLYKGPNSADGATPVIPEVGGVAKPLACTKAVTDLGYICIYTPQDLNNVRNNLAGKYILMNDIDLASFSPWTPMGTSLAGFKGELNGNGFKIVNFMMDQVATKAAGYSPTMFGLFGAMNYGTIQNLTIEGYTQTLKDVVTAGALVGHLNSTASTNPKGEPITIKNVRLTGNVSHSGTGAGMLAPLIGSAANDVANLTIDSIYYSGSILSTSPTTTSSSNVVAGLVGKLNVAYAPAGREINTTISNITLDGIDLNGFNIVAGLVSEINYEASDSVVAISDVSITGKMESGNKVSGLASQIITSNNKKFTHTISNYKVTAPMHTRGTGPTPVIAGLIETYSSKESGGSTAIKNVTISGAFTAANPSFRLIEISGVIGYYYSFDTINSATKSDPVDSLVVQNVDIASSMIGASNSSIAGFINRYKTQGNVQAGATANPKVTHTFTDINVSGEKSGNRVSGLMNDFIPVGANLDMTMANLAISGAMTGANATGLIHTYTPGNMPLNHQVSNVTVDSDITATTGGGIGLIAMFQPSLTAPNTDEMKIAFTGVDINGDIKGYSAAGISFNFSPRNGLMGVTLTDVSVNGVLTGTNVAGFANQFQPNMATPQKAMVTFLLDGFDFKGEMVGGLSVAGLFGTFNHNNTETSYTGLRDGNDYTFQNINLDGKVLVSNGSTGSYGFLIGKHFAEKRNNTYLFKNVLLSNEATIVGQTASFKKGRVADPASTGTADLIYDNVN